MNDLETYWAWRKERSLRRAPDPQAAESLLAELYRFSARQKRWGPNAGAWVTDMEFLAWRRQPKLHKLAAKAGGWWWWKDGVVFVPLAKWLPLYDLWLRVQEGHKDRLRLEHLLYKAASWHGFERWRAKHWTGGEDDAP